MPVIRNGINFLITTTALLCISSCGLIEEPHGTVKIATIPGDATISIDGVLKGNSPTDTSQFFSISLPEGKHTIDAFLAVNEELDKLSNKSIIVANKSEQVVTLTLADRFTDIGKVKQAERDAETKKQEKALAEKSRVEAEKAANAKKRAQSRIPPAQDGVFVFDTKNYKWIELREFDTTKEEGRGTSFLTDHCVDDPEDKKSLPYIPLKNIGEIILKGESYYRGVSIHNAFDTSKPGTGNHGPCFNRLKSGLTIKSYSQASKLQNNERKLEIVSKSEVNQRHIAIWLNNTHRFYIRVAP